MLYIISGQAPFSDGWNVFIVVAVVILGIILNKLYKKNSN